jgi:DNA protecting protein DprA
MLNSEKLGFIAFLNDRSETPINHVLRSLNYDVLDRVLEWYLTSAPETPSREEAHVLKLLQDRPLDKESFFRTIGRVEDYLGRGFRATTVWDNLYPNSLRLISDPPLILYSAGDRFPGDNRIAMAGAKGASKKGLAAAYEFGAKLAKRGHTIVSGLGKGIETEAHSGCLSAGGTSLAILGTPVTDIYPKENEPLAQEILHSGSLISDITEEARLYPGRVYQKYRIACGISDCLIVIEATEEGVIRQSDIAMKQGRKVFVVDQGDHKNQEQIEGIRRLKKMGATPVTYPEEIKISLPKQLKLF